MKRHAKVTNPITHKTFYVPYNGYRVDHNGKGNTVIEKVRAWCQEKKIKGPLVMIETASKVNIWERVY